MKKVVLFITLVCYSIISFSQAEIKSENSKFRFGFNLGANYSILHYVDIVPTNSELINGIGFQVGLFMDYSISNSFIISPKLETAFYNASVDFINSSMTTYDLMPASLNTMIHFVYRIGNNKMRPYFLVGPNFKLPIQKKPEIETEFGTNPDLAIDFGIGLENAFEYFIFAPEVRYSYGLRDVNDNPNLPPIIMHSIVVLLNFK